MAFKPRGLAPAEQRKQRLDGLRTIMLTTLNQGGEILRKKIVANLCLNFGITKNRADEYVDIIIDEQDLKEEDGLILKNG